MRLPEMAGSAIKLLMLLAEIDGVDRFPAQSVLVDVFSKNALLPTTVEAVMYWPLMVEATRLTVEMLLVTT